MIRIENISKSYGDNMVLNDMSTTIEEGCITAFIGPNGAGKSTLLGIVTRVLVADEGRVFIDEVELGDYKSDDLAKKLSVLRQQNDLQLRLTVWELVAFGRYPYSKGKLTEEDKRIVEEAISYMRLETLAERYIDKLSGGERQRAFIAMVIAQDTDYIFLDEPLNNLDMKHSVEIMDMLRRLCREKSKTVIIVIHDINFASCYADRVLAIQGNRIYINDTVEKVIDEDVLGKVYDMQFHVCDIEGDRICVYYKRRKGHGKHHHRGHRHGIPRKHLKKVNYGQ